MSRAARRSVAASRCEHKARCRLRRRLARRYPPGCMAFDTVSTVGVGFGISRRTTAATIDRRHLESHLQTRPSGGPSRNRTCDRRILSPLLYPSELLATCTTGIAVDAVHGTHACNTFLSGRVRRRPIPPVQPSLTPPDRRTLSPARCAIIRADSGLGVRRARTIFAPPEADVVIPSSDCSFQDSRSDQP